MDRNDSKRMKILCFSQWKKTLRKSAIYKKKNYVILHRVPVKENITCLNQWSELAYYTPMLPSSWDLYNSLLVEVKKGQTDIIGICFHWYHRCHLTFLDSALASLCQSSIGLEAQTMCEKNSFQDCVQLSGKILLFCSSAHRKHKLSISLPLSLTQKKIRFKLLSFKSIVLKAVQAPHTKLN